MRILIQNVEFDCYFSFNINKCDRNKLKDKDNVCLALHKDSKQGTKIAKSSEDRQRAAEEVKTVELM